MLNGPHFQTIFRCDSRKVSQYDLSVVIAIKLSETLNIDSAKTREISGNSRTRDVLLILYCIKIFNTIQD